MLYTALQGYTELYTAIQGYKILSRVRLDACGLNYYLFKIAVKSSLICSCGFDDETTTHFFLQCPNYAALRPDLLTAAAHIALDQWFKYSAQQKVSAVRLSGCLSFLIERMLRQRANALDLSTVQALNMLSVC